MGSYLENKNVLWAFTVRSVLSGSKAGFRLHSNVDEERVFSMVRKNKTTFRSGLGYNTLGSILNVKLSKEDALHFNQDKDLLKSAKSATSEYSKRHSSAC